MNIFSSIRKAFSQYTWDLAYGEYREDIFRNGIEWKNLHILKNPYKTKWFADPFILDVTDEKIIFLVEEFDSGVNRGRIAKLLQTDKLKQLKIVRLSLIYRLICLSLQSIVKTTISLCIQRILLLERAQCIDTMSRTINS